MSKKKPYSILFIEDEKEIRDNYISYLSRHFEEVYEAVDGKQGYRIYTEVGPDIIIADINIPYMNGLDLLKKIRETDYVTKFIILSAYSDVTKLLQATELKLVKYLVKPISRSDLEEALDLALDEFKSFEVVSKDLLDLGQGYKWNYDSVTLSYNEKEISLTKKETQVLQLFLSNPYHIFSYDDIIIEVWNDYEKNRLNSLKTIVKNLRKKLPESMIHNVFGRGYKFFQ